MYALDVDLGGISLADDAVDILDNLEGEERNLLVKWLKDAMKEPASSS